MISIYFQYQNVTSYVISEFSKSDKSLKHELVSIKDLLCYQCPCGTEVECRFPYTRDCRFEHSNPLFKNIIFVTEFAEFSKNI